MTASHSGFGSLLRSWRDRLSPADAGFTVTPGRRALGLRREELAQLAGLSVDYVLRLEQSRAKNPSAQVVGALARALQLSRAERDQLYRSAGLLPPQDGMISAHVPPSIQRQDAFEASIVADLKDAVSRYPTDGQLDRLLHDLRGVSDAFAHHWATGTPTQHTTDRKTIQHPEIGDIMLDCDVLIVPGADLRIVTYTAAAGSSDAGKLDLLRVTGARTATVL
ncbi:helix-turn-helix transcriptional regulator [Streptosporangium vulgare]|uniref:Helix-turn-helix transcriptional regulator n=1 Tax=Streptosporangium vulgare TaxID=46190 RepID=A0ABV5TL85_9ACTN